MKLIVTLDAKLSTQDREAVVSAIRILRGVQAVTPAAQPSAPAGPPPTMEERSRFYLRDGSGNIVHVLSPLEASIYAVLAVHGAGGITGSKTLLGLLRQASPDLWRGKSAATVRSAYSRLAAHMDTLGYPMTRKRGLYGFASTDDGGSR